MKSSDKHQAFRLAHIFAIDRLRMGTDGHGITTLVCFMGCPLRCAYCLNDRCHEEIYSYGNNGLSLKKEIIQLDVNELYDRVKVDDLYFQATALMNWKEWGLRILNVYATFKENQNITLKQKDCNMNGKDKCNLLREIRKRIATQYGLTYQPAECRHEGDCAGTCPKCDTELQDLQRQLKEKGIENIELDRQMKEMVDTFNPGGDTDNDLIALQGDVAPPEYNDKIEITEGMPVPLPEGMSNFPEPKKKRAFFKECAVAGWNFHHPEDFWDELYEGAELVLIRERANKHDRNAVAVALADDMEGDTENFDFDCIIGYVPRKENEMVAKMMDMGWGDAFTAELTTVKDNGTYDERLRMTIYIKSKIESTESWYVQKMDNSSCQNLLEFLYQDGITHFRWGGFPPWERDLPRKGDKVVFIHQCGADAELYLMHTIAIGEDAMLFLENPEEELNMVDDCAPYVLTLVKGPIIVDLQELNFLSNCKIGSCQPEEKLSEDCIAKLKDLFFKK